jgi:hypothetical protein
VNQFEKEFVGRTDARLVSVADTILPKVKWQLAVVICPKFLVGVV